MKVKESHWHEAAKADKHNDSHRSSEAAARRHQSTIEQTNAANKSRQSDSSVKDEAKFANLLESPAKPQKTSRQNDDASGEGGGEERKKDKKGRAGEKDSTELLAANDEKAEKYESFGGQAGGGGSGFGAGANVNQLNLSENFAARSILHIADLERLVSTIRSQINLRGRREIVLQLKRSVLEGLQVKISTDGTAGVSVDFLAANEAVRSQVNNHAGELAGILRGRGINLTALTTSLDTSGENENSASGGASSFNTIQKSGEDDSVENTFDMPTVPEGKIYQA